MDDADVQESHGQSDTIAREDFTEEDKEGYRKLQQKLAEYHAEMEQYRAKNPSPPEPRETSMMRKFRLHTAALARGEIEVQNALRDGSFVPDDPSPGWYFFYGTLMDADFLAEIAGLQQPPDMQPAVVLKARIRYWGPYPVLVNMKRNENQVHGMVCFLPTLEAVDRIRAYETDHYMETTVIAHLPTNKHQYCRTFKWSLEKQEEFLTEFPTEDPQPPLSWY